MRKKASITVETERLLVISHSRHAVESWCRQCDAKVSMIGVEEAAAVADVSERTIFHLIETGELHFMETAEGKALFCIDSLLRQRNSERALIAALLDRKQKG
jgi:hypothetical protein